MFSSYLKGCVPHANEEIFPGRIFWMKDGIYRFEYDRKHPNSFWIRYSIWEDFSQRFTADYIETKGLLKPIVEEAFKSGELMPRIFDKHVSRTVEDAFKSGELMPDAAETHAQVQAEEAFEIKELTPKPFETSERVMAEEVFQIGKLTPCAMNFSDRPKSETAFQSGQLTPLSPSESNASELPQPKPSFPCSLFRPIKELFTEQHTSAHVRILIKFADLTITQEPAGMSTATYFPKTKKLVIDREEYRDLLPGEYIVLS